MHALAALTLILAVYAIGDVLSRLTRGMVSMLFTSSVLFLAAFWGGVPTELFAASALQGAGTVLIPLLLVHMGTLLNGRQLRQQWKTVLIAVAAVGGIVVFLLVLGAPLMGRAAAMVAAPPLAGGVIASILMADAAKAAGHHGHAMLATLLLVVQGFVGYPLASVCLKREARRIRDRIQAESNRTATPVPSDDPDSRAPGPPRREMWGRENLYLAKTAVVALAAGLISAAAQRLTGHNVLDRNILALLLGILMAHTGWLERGVLNLAGAFGFGMAALLSVIFANLSTATPRMVLDLLPTLALALAIGSAGIVVFSLAAGALLKVSPWMSLAIGASALFGFPGTYVVPIEVARATGTTPEQVQAITDALLPNMLAAGFVTVSIASVILAGILGPML